MYFLQFEVTPNSAHPRKETLGGAIVSCWVQSDSIEKSTEIATKNIRECGFLVDAPDSATETSRDDWKKDETSLERFDSAIQDGEAYVFQEWPVDEPEK